jgi:TPR repeat protein
MQRSLKDPPVVKELVDKAKHMTGEEKQNLAMKYFLQAQRHEAGKDLQLVCDSDVFALRYYDASSRLGNLRAKNKVGVFHSKGRGGLPVNEEKAFQEFKTAAEAGLARAKRNMATYYARGCADRYPDRAIAYFLLNDVSICCPLTLDGKTLSITICLLSSALSAWPSSRDLRIRDQKPPANISPHASVLSMFS